MRTGLWILTSLILFSACCPADWTQWRGPFLNGTSDQTGLPDSLDPNTMLWKTALPGPGQATPIIAAGRVYLSGYNTEDKILFAACADADTGRLLWTKQASTLRAGDNPQRNSVAASSPAADAAGAVFLYADGTMVKYASDGTESWRRDLAGDYGPLSLKFGYGSSPLLYDGRLYVLMLRGRTPDRGNPGDVSGPLDSYLLYADWQTGKTIFMATRPTDALKESTQAYTTPLPMSVEGQTQIVVYGGDCLTGHNPVTGEELWRYRYVTDPKENDRLIPSPAIDGSRIYCAYPRGQRIFAIEVMMQQPPQVKGLWTCERPAPDVPCPVMYRDSLYLIEEKQKILMCLNPATGEERWTGQLDKADAYYASPTAADGKLYIVNRKGAVTVVAADANEFRILSRSRFEESPVDSTIAVSDGKLYLRTAENLYCFEKK